MIIEFKVANYRSIRDEQTLSFVASNYSDELPQNLIEAPIQGLKGAKLLKAAAIYGANASGKSNLLEALRFMVTFVRDSATGLRPDAPTGTHYFKLDPACASEPSKFELHAIINGTRMLYGLEVTRQRVTSEYLVAYPKGKPQVWFERDWNEETGKYEWSKSSRYFPHDEALRSRTRENASFISMAAQFGGEEARGLWEWFGAGIDYTDGNERSRGYSVVEAVKNDSFREFLKTVLSSADIGVLDVRAKRVDFPGYLRRYYKDEESRKRFESMITTTGVSMLQFEHLEPELLHRGKVGLTPMDYYMEESEGTRGLLDLISKWLLYTPLGALMIVDELEASLHPLLVNKFIQMYSEWTPDGAKCPQLLFTTHNPLLLDQSLLRRDQIWFTEKDQEGATRLYPLTDFKPRKDEALVKGYLSGRYGGIPFIPERLTATP